MNRETSRDPQRMPFIDALKAVGSQLIVLHHLAFYGPMSDRAYELVPGMIDWLYGNARIAVQVFLVVGGFLAARSLAPEGRLRTATPLALLSRRYLKLVIPYLAAIGIAIVCAAVARSWMDHDSIPDAPTAAQFAAHALLLHGVLNIDSLSAGVWYVAIDFQLFALLLALLWLGQHFAGPHHGSSRQNQEKVIGAALVAALAAASLYVFNLDADWDDWGIYFFGAYGLGALTYWLSARPRALLWLAALAALVGMALVVEFRSRIAVALTVALALGIARHTGGLENWPGKGIGGALASYFGKISYSVFLLNFPVALVINAAFSRLGIDDPALNIGGMIIAWIACNIAGALFFHFVESRTREWQERISQPFSAVFRLIVR
ncbi:acyltransferase family protein [Rhodocyclus gracilis]|uniref:acyltransferase family protein n=1 Tax=Rhodocyclus gracilis TaxID=2929842 RepID=UPI001E62DE11|nr:acyltransferase family protein [Rhodocyclus gracilis]